MIEREPIDFAAIRTAMASLECSPKVQPDGIIELDRVFFPDGHRGIFDFRRQLVVGNKGMGKSFWTHALLNPAIRSRLSQVYGMPDMARTDVVIGFNGSDHLQSGMANNVGPTRDEIDWALTAYGPDWIWRAVLLRAVHPIIRAEPVPSLAQALERLKGSPGLLVDSLAAADGKLIRAGKKMLIVFDALDHLSNNWPHVREMVKPLLACIMELQVFSSIRAKIFMQIDQLDKNLAIDIFDYFTLMIDLVELKWRTNELYGLLLFEMTRDPDAAAELRKLAACTNTSSALPEGERLGSAASHHQSELISAIAGEFVADNRRRGRTHTWVPLHLGDADDNCAPSTFLKAWKVAANHTPAPLDRVVDHPGLVEGVREASIARCAELREDYGWIATALEPLRGRSVPISRDELFALWRAHDVISKIDDDPRRPPWVFMGHFAFPPEPDVLLRAMTRIAVMEERANGKINVPEIFRVNAGILRRGGVTGPRRDG